MTIVPSMAAEMVIERSTRFVRTTGNWKMPVTALEVDNNQLQFTLKRLFC